MYFFKLALLNVNINRLRAVSLFFKMSMCILARLKKEQLLVDLNINAVYIKKIFLNLIKFMAQNLLSSMSSSSSESSLSVDAGFI